MAQTFTNSLAAFAAIVLAITSIGTIVSVPPASAQTSDTTIAMIELA
jgi:hypothetical protein